MKRLGYGTLNVFLILSLVIAPVQRVSACAEAGDAVDKQHVQDVTASQQIEKHCEQMHNMTEDKDQMLSRVRPDKVPKKGQCQCNGCSDCNIGHVGATAILSFPPLMTVNRKFNFYTVMRDDATLKVPLPVEIQPPIQVLAKMH